MFLYQTKNNKIYKRILFFLYTRITITNNILPRLYVEEYTITSRGTTLGRNREIYARADVIVNKRPCYFSPMQPVHDGQRDRNRFINKEIPKRGVHIIQNTLGQMERG